MTIFTVNSNSETLRQISDMLLDLYPDWTSIRTPGRRAFRAVCRRWPPPVRKRSTWPSWMSCFPR